MISWSSTITLLFLVSSLPLTHSLYTPCPILGPRYPRPVRVKDSKIVQTALKNLTAAFDELNLSGNSSYTQTTPETTTYSIGLFDANTDDQTSPFFYQYSHVAPSYANDSILDADSVYNIAGLTPVVTVYAALAVLDESQWYDAITKYLPQLQDDSVESSVRLTNWNEVRLIDLATHLSGLAREATLNNIPENLAQSLAGLLPVAEPSSNDGSEGGFLNVLQARAPIYQVATTPIYSDSGFQLLALALEKIVNNSFASILESVIFNPLELNRTTAGTPASDERIIAPRGGNGSEFAGSNISETALLAANGLFSTVSDLSRIGQSILRSELLQQITTNRWLKPHSYTSNLVNGVGMPFDIYTPTLSGGATGAIIPIFTKLGPRGFYSPYFGLVPDYGVGFVMLSADTDQAADLNAYADLIGEYLIPAIERTAAQQAVIAYAGNFTTVDESSTIEFVVDGLGGLSLANWTTNNDNLDVRSAYARLKEIPASSLDMRLYPTNLQDISGSQNTTRLAWRAVLQDMDAPVDAGTPTCITWEGGVDQFVYNGVSLDLFVFELDAQGMATGVQIPAFNMTLYKK